MSRECLHAYRPQGAAATMDSPRVETTLAVRWLTASDAFFSVSLSFCRNCGPFSPRNETVVISEATLCTTYIRL
jgi:hypothetical protein